MPLNSTEANSVGSRRIISRAGLRNRRYVSPMLVCPPLRRPCYINISPAFSPGHGCAPPFIQCGRRVSTHGPSGTLTGESGSLAILVTNNALFPIQEWLVFSLQIVKLSNHFNWVLSCLISCQPLVLKIRFNLQPLSCLDISGLVCYCIQPQFC